MKFFKKTTSQYANFILKRTEESFGAFLPFVGQKIQLACLAYELVSAMAVQHDKTQTIDKWIEHWDTIRSSQDI